MKKKKLLLTLLILIVMILCVFGFRIYSLVYSTWDYFHTDMICSGQHPTPSIGAGEPTPLSVYEVKPFTVITDYGNMYPGDEYSIVGEGMTGFATLLWTGNNGATFLVRYKSSGHTRYVCKWFIPIGNYR